MTITLYSCTADKNVLDKANYLTTVATVTNAVSRNAVDVSSPEIELQGNYTITQTNYCYIPELNRYYYILDIVIMPNNISKLILKSDVLYSFITTIKQSPIYAERSAKAEQQSPYVVDTEKPFNANKLVRTFNMGSIDDDSSAYTSSFIIVTAG